MSEAFKKAPTKRLIKKYTEQSIVTEDALDLFIDALDDYARILAKEAYSISRHAGRKTIQKKDIEYALDAY